MHLLDRTWESRQIAWICTITNLGILKKRRLYPLTLSYAVLGIICYAPYAPYATIFKCNGYFQTPAMLRFNPVVFHHLPVPRA